MITQDQRNAALVAAYNEVMKIVDHMIPLMFRSYAETYIRANPKLVANISDACLDAADSAALTADKTPPPPVHPAPTEGPSASVQHPST